MSFSKEVDELHKTNVCNAPGHMLSSLSPPGAPSCRGNEAVDSLILKTMFYVKNKKAQFQAPKRRVLRPSRKKWESSFLATLRKWPVKCGLDVFCRWETEEQADQVTLPSPQAIGKEGRALPAERTHESPPCRGSSVKGMRQHGSEGQRSMGLTALLLGLVTPQ